MNSCEPPTPKVLELFSGIGGMHYALDNSGIRGEIVAAIDINQIANQVYAHNFPETSVLNRSIQNITANFITDKLSGINTILMSPPCQPFTRVGLQNDLNDRRTDALKNVSCMLSDLPSVTHILMENVKGFEISQAHHQFINSLINANFFYKEFLVSPHQIGIPNTRYRYYCLARKCTPFDGDQNIIHTTLDHWLSKSDNPIVLKDFLQLNSRDVSDYLLSEQVIRNQGFVLDIVSPQSNNTNCFTKSYTHYVKGTGSVLATTLPLVAQNVSRRVDLKEELLQEYVDELKTLQLRYFTPREVAKLMSFPDSFQFPESTTERQKYKLLGNSINVKVVSDLIKILFNNHFYE